jgi:putative ABC transport system ATP-binding protein
MTQLGNAATPALSARGVKKGFGSGATRVQVLHGVDLDAYAGEILLLVGPSGCGKTTLLCLLAGLLDADDGSIQVLGSQIDKLSAGAKTEFRKGNVGFIFQQFNLIPTLTAAENAAVPLLVKGVALKEAIAKATEMLGRVGLGHRVSALPATLSGGEQQRVAIARALVSAPRLLICDEPTAALDGDTGQKVMESLRATSLDSNRCVIVVTHDSRIFKFGDRIARMLDGRITSVEKMTAAANTAATAGAEES